MNDISRKAKRSMRSAEDKARDLKDDAQQKLDDIMPGTGSKDSNSHRRSKR